ncbi:C40 family peptidase [Agromyces humi]|uniref:C40 family peptidase n=1 Tax=Agromyces humi TaxID=1766800 RepID=UPI00135A8156|nr:C40 family peptidase [Agromyces humi]
MSYTDALSRIDEIRTTLGFEPATTPKSQEVSATTAAEFDATLTASAPTGVSGEDIVAEAKKYLGVPYVLGGEDSTGMDCSGLVQTVLNSLGIDSPRLVRDQQNIGTEVGSLADAKPGDLIVTHNADHIVIYAGDGMVVHAPYEGRTVSYQKNWLTDADIQTIRRVVPDAPAPSTASTVTSAQNAQLEALQKLIAGSTTTGSSNSLIDLIGASQLTAFGRTS